MKFQIAYEIAFGFVLGFIGTAIFIGAIAGLIDLVMIVRRVL